MINFFIDPINGIVETGINVKLSEYQAAVVLVNLDKMDNVLEHRAELFQLYSFGLKDLMELPTWHSNANFNGAYMPVKLENRKKAKQLISKLAEEGIQSRAYFSPSLDSVFSNCKNHGTENSDEVVNGILCLPLHFHMTKKNISSVIEAIKRSGTI